MSLAEGEGISRWPSVDWERRIRAAEHDAYDVIMGLLATLMRFNAAHPWSHNDAFTGFVLRQARAVRRQGGGTAADVGCGTGNMVEHMTHVFPEVVGIEPDHNAAAIAAQRFRQSRSVRIEQRHFGEELPHRYDLIVFVASLHHMPLSTALGEAVTVLRPGGRIVIVGLARETRSETPRSLISLVLNPIVGFMRHPTRATEPPEHMQSPTAYPNESFEEIRAIASELLPGIRMRRRLFWRYTGSWRA